LKSGAPPMGSCIISVHVTGSHHNSVEHDIDQMAAEFVDELRRKHNVTAAFILAGNEHNLLNTGARFPIKVQGGKLPRNGVPGRCRVAPDTRAEKALRDAVAGVEVAGAHPWLTDAVNLLQKARNKVADFIEHS